MATKEELNVIQASGRIIIRSQCIKGMWTIVYKTERGGWSPYFNTKYDTKEICDQHIDQLVEDSPKFYHDK